MNSRLKKGLITGGLIGGALTGLFMSKKGKELRKEGLKHAAELYRELEKKAEHLTELSQEKYEELVELVVTEFGKKKELAEDVKDQIVKRLKAQWEHLEVDGLVRKVKKEFSAAKSQTKETYAEVVDDVVVAYAKEKKLAVTAKTHLARELKKRWETMK